MVGDILKKILFFIPNLMHGGAEKVLVNLVNNLDASQYDITVQTIFDVGVNKQYLKSNIEYRYVFKKIFRGNTTLFKLFSPEFLFKVMIKEHYDIIVSYLEGPTARILAGCRDSDVKKIAWIHTEFNSSKDVCKGFRNIKEAKRYYSRYDKIVAVSETVKKHFKENLSIHVPISVLYNTIETELIVKQSKEIVDDVNFDKNIINICSVGRIIKIKGYAKLAVVHKRLQAEGIEHRIYILGVGEEKEKIEEYLLNNDLSDTFIFLGYKDNPYKYVRNCDLYVCSSIREGFSTAVTEALVVGTPVITTLCSGMEEILGEDNEYGLIVRNCEDGLYQGLKKLLTDKEYLVHYRRQAQIRGKEFTKGKNVKAVEDMLKGGLKYETTFNKHSDTCL